MTLLTPEHLLTILPPETVKQIWEFCNGNLVYFPSKPLEYKEIKDQYKELMEAKIMKHSEAVKILSKRFNKSYKTIDKIVKSRKKDKILD
ncbi:hypothetical protein [Hydrogenimonas thermophila]|uniref:Mor transcription activator family protein n=1 Tax=Hydrogenimonas thermophila TaxID=223786 RepID=A0A1I5LIH0_9BACT|nr:hypothetical protein [Hydrogenimonas thermophila]SFO96973.1 hypothetical protein SAMN05216234_10342 [Hydrogenimonas thermophila]